MDILQELTIASYSGIEFPVSTYSWGFAHDDQKFKFIFKDQQYVMPLGRQNRTFRFSVPLFENIQTGLYTEVFPNLLAVCENTEPDILNTPDLGVYQAKIVSFSPTYDPNKRDGGFLDLEFIEAPELDQEYNNNRYAGPATIDNLAATLDAEVEFADIPDYIPPRNGFQNPLRAATAILDQVSLTRDQFKAQIDNVAYEIDRLNTAIDNTSNPQNWSLKRQNNNLKRSIYETKRNIDTLGKDVVEEIVNTPKNIMVLASESGMSLKAFLRLNSSLAGFVVVPMGTKILRPNKKR
jgi:hypothetical protein